MRPRPFKFFFALSLGVILFVFFARFVIMAFFFAAILSVTFYVGRRIKNFFRRLSWEDEYDYGYEYGNYKKQEALPIWKEDLLVHYPNRQKAYMSNQRTIKVL